MAATITAASEIRETSMGWLRGWLLSWCSGTSCGTITPRSGYVSYIHAAAAYGSVQARTVSYDARWQHLVYVGQPVFDDGSKFHVVGAPRHQSSAEQAMQ